VRGRSRDELDKDRQWQQRRLAQRRLAQRTSSAAAAEGAGRRRTETFLIDGAHAAITRAPDASDPVKATLSACGWLLIRAPTDGPPTSTLRTPAGSPACQRMMGAGQGW
jgi:hypothetical protein